jgi:hypothetical protein
MLKITNSQNIPDPISRNKPDWKCPGGALSSKNG